MLFNNWGGKSLTNVYLCNAYVVYMPQKRGGEMHRSEANTKKQRNKTRKS